MKKYNRPKMIYNISSQTNSWVSPPDLWKQFLKEKKEAESQDTMIFGLVQVHQYQFA